MRDDYYPHENWYPRSEYYPAGYREDEEMWVYDQCCANCARSQANCPFLAYANREKVSRAKRKAVKLYTPKSQIEKMCGIYAGDTKTAS